MKRQLPPLNALRAFEAAARHESMTRAGAELGVTHGAVARQVKALEEHLGLELFRPAGRNVALTALGRQYYAGIFQALELIADETAKLSPRQHGRVVSVSVTPAFALRWLVPRLPAFESRHPEAEVRVITSYEMHDLGSAAVDLAIRQADAAELAERAHRVLLHDDLIPVVRAAEERSETEFWWSALPHLEDSWDHGWPDWYAARGAAAAGRRIKRRGYPDAAVVIEATLAGQGVGLVRRSFAEADLAQGRLVQLDRAALPSRYPTFIVWSRARPLSGLALAFVRWLEREAEAWRALSASEASPAS